METRTMNEVHRLCTKGDKCSHFTNDGYCYYLHPIKIDDTFYNSHINVNKFLTNEDVMIKFVDKLLNNKEIVTMIMNVIIYGNMRDSEDIDSLNNRFSQIEEVVKNSTKTLKVKYHIMNQIKENAHNLYEYWFNLKNKQEKKYIKY